MAASAPCSSHPTASLLQLPPHLHLDAARRRREAPLRLPADRHEPRDDRRSGAKNEMAWMAKADEPVAQLATRIPKDLHRRLKLHCVTHDIVLMHFVVEAIAEKLGRKPGKTRKP